MNKIKNQKHTVWARVCEYPKSQWRNEKRSSVGVCPLLIKKTKCEERPTYLNVLKVSAWHWQGLKPKHPFKNFSFARSRQAELCILVKI